jgi:hypothetical protein
VSVNVLPVSACVMTTATPAGGATDTDGEVGIVVGVLGPGRAADEPGFGVAAPVCVGVATGAAVVGVPPAVAVTAAVAVVVGDDAGAPALRWWVQPARATSPATTAQYPAR